MIFLSLLMAYSALAKGADADILAVFKKTHDVQAEFLKDTMNNRVKTESFHENEFVPAVNQMISLLSKNQCTSCPENYLKALAELDQSATETLTDQLSQIIEQHPRFLAAACSKIGKATRLRLKVRLSDAVAFLAIKKKLEAESVRKSIKTCF